MNKSFKKRLIKRINTLGVHFFILWLITVVTIIGMGFNFEAIMSNGGKMPVQTDFNYETEEHFSFQDKDEVNNYYLTDIIKTGNMTSSIGDWIMWISFLLMFMVVFKIMKKDKIK